MTCGFTTKYYKVLQILRLTESVDYMINQNLSKHHGIPVDILEVKADENFEKIKFL